MRTILANIVNAWLRGTLHAVNGVLFAKYLALAWGIEPSAAVGLSGTATGALMMRGKIFGAVGAAWRLVRVSNDLPEWPGDSLDELSCNIDGAMHSQAANPTRRGASSRTGGPAKISASE